MIRQYVFLLSIALLSVQIKDGNSDLVDEARAQVENLEIVVSSNGNAVKDTISFKDLDLMYSSMSAEDTARVAIENQKVLVNEQLAIIKILGVSAGVNISLCFQDYEDYLDALPDQIYNSLEKCVGSRIADSSKLLKAVKPLIDRFSGRVADIAQQIDFCKSDSCIFPIMDFLAVQEENILGKLSLEKARAQDLYDVLAAAINECQQNFVADYQLSTILVINDIQNCINTLLS